MAIAQKHCFLTKIHGRRPKGSTVDLSFPTCQVRVSGFYVGSCLSPFFPRVVSPARRVSGSRLTRTLSRIICQIGCQTKSQIDCQKNDRQRGRIYVRQITCQIGCQKKNRENACQIYIYIFMPYIMSEYMSDRISEKNVRCNVSL